MENKDLSIRVSRELPETEWWGNILGMLRLCARPASGTRAPLSKTDQKELGQTVS
jgi:hypothetical protein